MNYLTPASRECAMSADLARWAPLTVPLRIAPVKRKARKALGRVGRQLVL
jgi:hypothetical protein